MHLFLCLSLVTAHLLQMKEMNLLKMLNTLHNMLRQELQMHQLIFHLNHPLLIQLKLFGTTGNHNQEVMFGINTALSLTFLTLNGN
jgi:hypothetical protein